MTEQTSIEWLRMMQEHSGLVDCKPRFGSIATEIEALQARVAELQLECDQKGRVWVAMSKRMADTAVENARLRHYADARQGRCCGD